jgi:TonB family protein
MKFLARCGLALYALFAVVTPLAAQYQNPDWVEVSPVVDSFRVSLPVQPRLEIESVGAVSGNRYVAPTVGAVYTVWSITNANYRSGQDTDQYLDATAELVWEGLLKPAREKLDDKARRLAAMSYVKDLPPKGLPGREYNLTIGDVTGTAEFFVAHEHLYVLLVMGQPGGDWPREKFFQSFHPASNVAQDLAAPANAVEKAVGPAAPAGVTEDYNRVFTGKEVTQKVRVLEKPEPTYTESARKFGVQGTVVIRCVFSKNGEVTNVHVVNKLPHGLTQQSISAAHNIRFTPAMKDGQAVSMWMELQYNFNLY